MNWMRILILLSFLFLQEAGVAQKPLRQPASLLRSDRPLNINVMLSEETGLATPWIVYCDRNSRGLRFGGKYYVTAERETGLRLREYGDPSARALSGSGDAGWIPKADLLVNLSAELSDNPLLHRKGLVVIPPRAAGNIAKGDSSKGYARVYPSPDGMQVSGYVPVYSLWFIYKSGQGRYLIGQQATIDPQQPFHRQMAGWIDTAFLMEYNTRLCVEPSWEISDVIRRRCDRDASLKGFGSAGDLGRALSGDTLVTPLWSEPLPWFLKSWESKNQFHPDSVTGSLASLCDLSGSGTEGFARRIFTGGPLPGSVFRFPVLKTFSGEERCFIAGLPGISKTAREGDQAWCDSLRLNKADVSVFFLLDRSIDRSRLTYLISQIHQEYTGFHKRYGIRFYPAPPVGMYHLRTGSMDAGGYRDNYEYIRDFIMEHRMESSRAPGGEHVLKALQSVLKTESFSPKQTNIIVVVNNRTIPVPDTSLASLRRDISEGILRNNAYLLVFDYGSDNNLMQQVQEIVMSAGRRSAAALGMPVGQVALQRSDFGYELAGSGLLAILEQSDTAQLPAAQMQNFVLAGYQRMLTTLDRAIRRLCDPARTAPFESDEPGSGLNLALTESRNINGGSSGVPTMQAAFFPLGQRQKGNTLTRHNWKASVLLTRNETEELVRAIERVTETATPNQAVMALARYREILFSRIAGERLPEGTIMQASPVELVERLTGDSWGYDLTSPVQSESMNLLQNDPVNWDQEITPYLRSFAAAAGKIKSLLSANHRWCRADPPGNPATSSGTGVCYYWIPLSWLP